MARELREKNFTGEIIFLTYSREAIYHAFDVKANNYLLKELATESRIEEVFLAAAELVKEKTEEYLLLTGVGEYRNVAIGEVIYKHILLFIIYTVQVDTHKRIRSPPDRPDSRGPRPDPSRRWI